MAATGIARGAGTILAAAYQKAAGRVQTKSTAIDLVTDADRESEEYILGEIRRRYPDHAVLAEESGANGAEAEVRWVIDPLDGTVNFAHRLPAFCVLIAVQERHAGGWHNVVSVTHNPLADELFAAADGVGATLNGEPLRVSSSPRLIDAIGATGFQYDRLFRREDNHREFVRMNLLTQGVRRIGSAGLDLAYVACGRLDFMWEYGLRPWDVSAGILLVAEAGGTVTSFDGGDAERSDGNVVATNGHLHEALLAALASAHDQRIDSRDGLEDHLPEDVAAELHARRGRG
jgi:myo-inositol-1(or 4)-monophosphatase